MRRRKFSALLRGATTLPILARAQESGKLPTIGYLGASKSAEAARDHRLCAAAAGVGLVAIEYWWGEARADHWAEITAEFARLEVDVIAIYNTPTTLTAKKVTSVVPIVSCLGRGIMQS
jgi:hypothetical protein